MISLRDCVIIVLVLCD